MKEIIKKIENNETFKQVLKDSYGGIMFNSANKYKYKDEELFKLINSLTSEQIYDISNGLTRGAVYYLRGLN